MLHGVNTDLISCITLKQGKMDKEIETYLESNHLSYYSALRNNVGSLVSVGDLINNYTKHLTEQLAEYKGIAQTESVRADNLQDQLAEKEKECEDILKWTLHNYKPYEDGMTMIWRNINPDVDTLHTSKELYEIFKTRKQWKQ
jgi:hypothetical protein